MRSVAIAIVFPLISSGCSNQTALEKEYSECLTTLSPLQKLYDQIGLSLEQDCADRAEKKIRWESAGSPTFRLNRSGCEFLGKRHSRVEKCIPEEYSDRLSIVSVEAHLKVQTEVISRTLDLLREFGVKELMLTTTDDAQDI